MVECCLDADFDEQIFEHLLETSFAHTFIFVESEEVCTLDVQRMLDFVHYLDVVEHVEALDRFLQGSLLPIEVLTQTEIIQVGESLAFFSVYFSAFLRLRKV